MLKRKPVYSKKSKEMWRSTLKVIRDHFQSRLDENVYFGVRDEKVYHGLRETSSIILNKVLSDMCFCGETQEYLVLNAGVELQRYSLQGKCVEPSIPLNQANFEKILWCDGVNCLVCYDVDSESVQFVTSSGRYMNQLENEFNVKKIYYIQKTNEILIIGAYQSVKYLLNFDEEELDPQTVMSYNDPEFGSNWQLDCTSLILSDTDNPILVSAYLTTLYLISVQNEDDSDDEDNANFLGRVTNASKDAITVVHFDEISSWVITGDKIGNVIAWNLKLECMMSCSGAHDDEVVGIVSHPMICGFISYSHDPPNGVSKLQVWSCNFRDRIESFTIFGDIRSILVNRTTAGIVVLATNLSFFTMHQIYYFFAPLTEPAVTLYSTKSPMYSIKIVAACKDNVVRLFDKDAKQLNIQLLSKELLDVQSAIYSGMTNKLITMILKTGEILSSDTTVFPVKYKHVFVNDGPPITCMALYEHFDEIRTSDGQRRQPRLFYSVRTLIIVGREDGNLIVINETDGKHESIHPAHKGSVVQLKSSSIWKQAISLGLDRCVKVWRIFPDLSQVLVIYYTFYFIIPITLVSIMGNTVCMVNSSKNSRIHQVLMENTSLRVRLEHHSSKDHTAQIINMIADEELEICITSSLDNTIRIWDHDNCLNKILFVNTVAWHMAFSSNMGDFVFSAGRHLYKIPYENYLAPKYRTKIVKKNIYDELENIILPKNKEFDSSEVDDMKNVMFYPVSSMPLRCIDVTNTDDLRVEVLILNQICALLNFRDLDIIYMKNNFIMPMKIVANRALMNTKEWDKYVKKFLKTFDRPLLETPPHNFIKLHKLKTSEKKVINKFGVFHMLYGYKYDKVDDIDTLTELTKNSKLPLHGFLTNSILYKPYDESDKPKIVVKERVKKILPKYKYPPEFYPKVSQESIGPVSIRFSQILLTEDQGEGEA